MPSKQTALPSRSQAIRKRAGRLPRLPWVVAGMLVAGLLGWLLYRTPGAPTPRTGAEAAQAHPAGPPWRHGPADARFTLTLYADLECPFCKAYYPTLMAWIDTHPEASLRWHHLPLAMHDPGESAGPRGRVRRRSARPRGLLRCHRLALPKHPRRWPGAAHRAGLARSDDRHADLPGQRPPRSHRSRAGRRGPAQRHQRHAHRAA